MKKAFKDVSFVFLLLKMCLIFGQETVVQKRILIDVGHGGKDSGAIGANGLKEKDVVLDIALEILSLNKDLESPLEIYLTRNRDTLISLSDRTNLAKTLNSDIFISLHCNHSDNQKARGVEIYVGGTNSKFLKDAIWLAFQLQAEFTKHLGFESRGVKFANFQVLRETFDSLVAVLLELGFLSNYDESRYFSSFKNLRLIAETILNSIKKQ